MIKKENRKILLVQPPVRDFYFTAKRSIPYGLLSIASSLRQRGFEVSVLDALATSRTKKLTIPAEMSYLNDFYGREDVSPFALFNGYKHFGLGFESIARKAAEEDPFLVGISSLFTAYSDVALETARNIKKALPKAVIVMGGHHATAIPDHLIESGYVDFVIRGEGENSMADLVEAILSGSPFDKIEGLVYRDSKGSFNNSGRAVVSDLSILQVPALDLYDHGFYSRRDGGSSVITSSRGCPMRCSYCCVGSSNITWRKRKPEQVIEEIRISVESHGTRFIDFEDENLSLDSGWFNEILDAIIELFPGLELRAMNGLFPPSLKPDLMKKMRKAGFRTLNLSVGSTSKDQLKRFGRPDVIHCLDDVIDSASEAGLECVCYIIAGAPGQSLLSSMDDLDYFASRKTLVGVSVYYPAPGSCDYGMISDSGRLPSSYSLMRSSAMPMSSPGERPSIATVMRAGRILNFLKSLGSDDIKNMKRQNSVEIGSVLPGIHDRTGVGLSLFDSFMKDQKIRGVERNGLVYEHLTDSELCDKLSKICVKFAMQ